MAYRPVSTFRGGQREKQGSVMRSENRGPTERVTAPLPSRLYMTELLQSLPLTEESNTCSLPLVVRGAMLRLLLVWLANNARTSKPCCWIHTS